MERSEEAGAEARMVQIPDDEHQEPAVAGGMREEPGREHWWFDVGKGLDLLCPPTAGGRPAHIWDIRLAVLRHFGHSHVNIAQKACKF
jgi:hypothetical protein